MIKVEITSLNIKIKRLGQKITSLIMQGPFCKGFSSINVTFGKHCNMIPSFFECSMVFYQVIYTLTLCQNVKNASLNKQVKVKIGY